MKRTLKEIIALADSIRPNAFSEEVKASWVNEAEHIIQTEILLIAPPDLTEYVPYEEKKDVPLTLETGNDGIYLSYLTAMIDFADKEYAGYNNSIALFNEQLDTYAKWYVRTHRDGEPLISGMYLSAYGIAVSHGYTGTEEEWLLSLKGDKGDTGHGLNIKGVYETLEELLAGVLNPSEGDIYQVGTSDNDKTLYLYSGAEWKDIGSYRGEKGAKGDRGDTGAKGDKGDTGDAGKSATITGVTATVDTTTGTPSVIVNMNGTESERSFDFAFSGLKGEKGDPGEKGEKGDAGGLSADLANVPGGYVGIDEDNNINLTGSRRINFSNDGYYPFYIDTTNLTDVKIVFPVTLGPSKGTDLIISMYNGMPYIQLPFGYDNNNKGITFIAGHVNTPRFKDNSTGKTVVLYPEGTSEVSELSDALCGKTVFGLLKALANTYLTSVKTQADSPLVKNTVYDLGLKTSLVLTLPQESAIGDYIQIDFISPEEATALTVTGESLGWDFSVTPPVNLLSPVIGDVPTPEANKLYSLYCEWGIVSCDSAGENKEYGWRVSFKEYPVTIKDAV